MSFSDFIKNDNKSIIWGLLQEGGIFNDIPNVNFENVKRLFETSILSMKPEFDIFFDKNDEGDDDYDNKATEMIMNSNKNVIKKMIHELEKFKKPRQLQPTKPMQPMQPMQPIQQPPTSQLQSNVQPTGILPIPPRYMVTSDSSKNIDAKGSAKKTKIEEIYRADDLQNHRMSELEIRLKEKQEEMDTMLNNKKPTSIDFSDNTLNDNKLASDEMEKLLAHALSSRQRELEQLTTNSTLHGSKNAEEWISGSSDPVTKAVNASIAIKRSHDIKRPVDQSSVSIKKNVSFNDENNENILYDKQDTTDAPDGIALTNNDNLSFLTKLKRKNTGPMNMHLNTNIPLDAFMSEYDEDAKIEENYSYHEHRLDGFDKHEYARDARDARDTRDYDKLESKINNLQSYMESIKSTQDKILDLLLSKTDTL